MSDKIRIQRSRKKGWKLPSGTRCVDRTTRWGNPYSLDRYSRTESLELYEKRVVEMLEKDPLFFQPLWGMNLACWCPLAVRCHADILLAYFADSPFGARKGAKTT